MVNDTGTKTSSKKGCLVTLIIFGLMFGIPALVMFSGITADGLLAQIFMVLVAALVNFGLYKYRKSQVYTKTTYYDLKPSGHQQISQKPLDAMSEPEALITVSQAKEVAADVSIVDSSEQIPPVGKKFCTACGTKITPGNKFCSHCGNKL